jgi:hypothetical protein
MKLDGEQNLGPSRGGQLLRILRISPYAQKVARAVRACKIEGEAILADLECKGKQGENEGQ